MGTVVRHQMQKTATVAVVRQFRHPKFGKVVRRTRKFLVHDPNDELRSGDRVRIIETRPLSRHKRWRLLEVVERAR
ncbi:MAG: 30S ribosomal protein S17 [Nitrospinota bacterium]